MNLTIEDKEWSIDMETQKVKVIGVGGAGLTILKELKSSYKFPALNVSLILCDVCINTLSIGSLEGINTCYVENVFLHGLGCAGDMKKGEAICHENNSIIEHMMEDCEREKIVICGALSGGFSGGFLSYISKKGMMNKNVYLYLIYPIRLVRQRRIDNANRVLESVKSSGLDYTIFYIDEIIDQNYDYLKENDMLRMSGAYSLTTDIVAKEILKDLDPYIEQKNI